MSHGLAHKRHRNDRSGSNGEQYETQRGITKLKLLFQGGNVASPDAESEPVCEEHGIGRASRCADDRRRASTIFFGCHEDSCLCEFDWRGVTWIPKKASLLVPRATS